MTLTISTKILVRSAQVFPKLFLAEAQTKKYLILIAFIF
jgi:hypothetical protein